jgi:hypothetical protein
MLFDLRARGRRRTVQVVYLGLAILFVLGFVVLGIGTGAGGGESVVESIFGSKEGAASSSYTKQVKAAETRTRLHPSEAAAWAALVDAQFHQANGSEYYDETKQQFTSQGKALLTKISNSWSRYMALNPSAPSLKVANDMLRVYGQEGLNQPAEAVQILQLLIPSKPPSASLYGELATFAYQAKNTRVGDLASKKTLSLTPAAQRPAVKAELEKLKANPTGNPSNETYTTTTNGKAYKVKLGPNGTATGTEEVKTTPAPAPAKK